MRAGFPAYARCRGESARATSRRIPQRCVSGHRQGHAARRPDALLSRRPSAAASRRRGGDQRHHRHAARRLSQHGFDPARGILSSAALALGRMAPRPAPVGAARRHHRAGRTAASRRSGFSDNVGGQLVLSTRHLDRRPRSCSPRAGRLRRHAVARLSIGGARACDVHRGDRHPGALQRRDHRLRDALRLPARAHRVGVQDARCSTSTAWRSAWPMRRSANTAACTSIRNTACRDSR